MDIYQYPGGHKMHIKYQHNFEGLHGKEEIPSLRARHKVETNGVLLWNLWDTKT